MTVARPDLSQRPPTEGMPAAQLLPPLPQPQSQSQWIIFQYAGAKITAISPDQALLFNAGSQYLGRIEASDKEAALTQWEHLEREVTCCVVEAHMLNGEASAEACFAVFALTPVFLRNVQALAAQLSEIVSLSSSPIGIGKPRTLTMAFDEPAAHVRWDNPDVGEGHWELVVNGDERVLRYAAIDADCSTTGMHLVELEKIFARHNADLSSITAHARPDSYGELIEAIEAAQGDTHMADISPVLDSALAWAFEVQKAIDHDQRTQRESADAPL